MILRQTFKVLSNSSIVHVLISFALMGGWAFFANQSHPMPAPIYAGLLQGLLSGTITLGMKKALEALFQYWVKRGRAKTGLITTPLTVCSVSASSLLACHAIAGTPELIATIIVPSSVALIYAYGYTYAMWRQCRSTA